MDSLNHGSLLLYGISIFLAAALLFVVQPMVGRMVLPRLGGSPEVWNTSMVFFQLALLVGYAYAHFSVRWLGPRRQLVVHAVVLFLPLLVLPVALPDWSSPADGWQSPWLLLLLAAAVGAPFFVLATASPLLQRWFSSTRHEAADDPYFLYAASNAGSLLGLLAYPFLVEPTLSLGAQSTLWSVGYGIFVLLVLACGAVAFGPLGGSGRDTGSGVAGREVGDERARDGSGPGGRFTPDRDGSEPGGPVSRDRERDPRSGLSASPTARDRLLWIACAFVPSSLLLGVTHYLTTDVAPVPLLWVVPLAVYLITFIIAFSRRYPVSVPTVSRYMAIVAVALALVFLGRIREPVWAMILLHLAVLAVAGLLCHGRLAERRPATSHLTEFYLWVSVGGVLGGAFNALVAPQLFSDLVEYPIALFLACLLRVPFSTGGARERDDVHGTAATAAAEGDGTERVDPDRRADRRSGGRLLDLALPAAVAVYLVVVEVASNAAGGASDALLVVLTAAVPVLAVFFFSPHRLRFALGIAVLLAFAYGVRSRAGDILVQERTFFGVYRIVQDPGERFMTLYHGTTVHGLQSQEPGRTTEALGYYHPAGPGGHVVARLADRPGEQSVALVGLGTGALAALTPPRHDLTFYEIDPAVVRMAEDPRYFTYLEQSRSPYDIVVGDGRIGLAESDERFDLIVLDAFSSASVPVHLLTREALQLYLDRLRPGGALLFHISSRHLDLGPVLGTLAVDLGLAVSERVHTPPDEVLEQGVLGSRWVLMGRTPDDIVPFLGEGWRGLRPDPEARPWTDDYADVLSVYRWN